MQRRKMNPVALSVSASESLKSKILRRVREEEKQLSPETMANTSSGRRFATRSWTGTRKNESRKSCGSSKSHSLRSSSRTQMREAQPQSQEPNSKSHSKRTSRGRGRGRGRPIKNKIPAWANEAVSSCKKEASQSSSSFGASHVSSEAKPRPGPIKRRLRSSSTSLASAPPVKTRRVEDDSDRGRTPPRSPSPNSANMKNSWMVTESPCSLVIVEKKSPEHQRKILISESAETFCSCTDDRSCDSVRSTKSGRKKKSKVHLTRQMHDSCPLTEKLRKKMQPKSNTTSKVSKQKKKINDADAHVERPTRRSSKVKDGKIKPKQHTPATDDHLNYLLQDSRKSNQVGALSSMISQTSPGIVRKEHASLVRELIHRRINQTLATQNDQKKDATSSNKPKADAPASGGISSTTKHQLAKTAKQEPSLSDVESTTISMTVTKTAAAEAAKAVGGISLMPLHKASNPDFLPAVSSPCTPTMTVMKASSDQRVSSTMSSESKSKGPLKTKVSSDPEKPLLASGPFGTSGCHQPVAQCKCVASVSTVPTPSLIEVGNIQVGQPIFLSPESFQFEPISYPGMAAYNAVDMNPAACGPQSSKRKKKKRNSKKKSVEKESLSPVSTENPSSLVTVSSASSPPDPDTKDPEFKDPSLDDKGEKIKRPMNAFMIWSREQRSILARQRPKMTNADISVKLGIMWNDLDYSVKQKYFDEAIKLKLQHRKDYPDWVYQPRPHKRPSRSKRQPMPFYEDKRQQTPYTQMVLIMPDGQQVLCPAIPAENCRGAAPMMANFVMPGPPIDIKDAKNVLQQSGKAPTRETTKSESPVTPAPPADANDAKKSANQYSEQAKSKMLVIMPNGQQVVCPMLLQQNCHATKPVTTDIAGNVTAGPSLDVKDVKKNGNQHSEQPKPELLLVMPDGKQVFCPDIPKSKADDKDVKKFEDQPSEQSSSSEEKLVVVKSEKCGDDKRIITVKLQSGLPTPINLGPVIQLTKDKNGTNTKSVPSSLTMPEVKPASSVVTSEQQQLANEEKKIVPSLQMADVKDKLEPSQGITEPVLGTKPAAKLQSDTPKVMEMNDIVKSEAMTVPVAITTMAQVQSSSRGGSNQSAAESSESIVLMSSNPHQQSTLVEMNSLQAQPVNNLIPVQQVSRSFTGTGNSSRLHPVDNSQPAQRRPIPQDGSSQQFPTSDFSQPHPAVTLLPIELQEPGVHVHPISKDTGVQTLQDRGSCPSSDQTNQTLPTHFPSSVLKNQPIDMVWHADSRILQPANISDKGTSTSYPFYFTPIQQVPGVQGASTGPPMGSPALRAPMESCMVPLPTATLTGRDPSDVALPATQFADTPTLCEISEPERLLESLAMSGVEISEDEAEETENLFQRVMNMVTN